MKWNIRSTLSDKGKKTREEEILNAILKNRNIKKSTQDDFLRPPHPSAIHLRSVGVKKPVQDKAAHLVKTAAKSDAPIVVYGDYDADGITATAILWETLHKSGIHAMPFIPHRVNHGYGLSQAGLNEVIATHHPKLIVAVDNGVTAIEETRYAKNQGVKVIVIDHHVLTGEKHPADALVHSIELSGAGLTWIFSNELRKNLNFPVADNALELAAIGTVADLVPLVGPSRSIVKHGLDAFRTSSRIGLNALIEAAGLKKGIIDTYHLGYHLAPRLNAMGRLEHAIESLRLLCTNDVQKAKTLAKLLNDTNRERQDLTDQLTELGVSLAQLQKKESALVVSHKDFHEGIIGLVAGKLVQQFWKPSIAIAKGEKFSKGSARSIPGFNIIEAIRKLDYLLDGAGGHPMAAGFAIRTDRIDEFQQAFQKLANELIAPDLLERTLSVDTEVEFSDLTHQLINSLTHFHPFGVGNPHPVFSTHNVNVRDARTVGADGKHLKLFLEKDGVSFSAIGFGMGSMILTSPAGGHDLRSSSLVSIAYTPESSIWNGHERTELKLRDMNVLV